MKLSMKTVDLEVSWWEMKLLVILFQVFVCWLDFFTLLLSTKRVSPSQQLKVIMPNKISSSPNSNSHNIIMYNPTVQNLQCMYESKKLGDFTVSKGHGYPLVWIIIYEWVSEKYSQYFIIFLIYSFFFGLFCCSFILFLASYP